MENASKALLIAGAILLVIALIAVGMSIFGTAKGVVNNAEGQVNSLSVKMHNQQFSPYDGEITGTQVKECISKVLSNNTKATSNDFKVGITVNSDDYISRSVSGAISNNTTLIGSMSSEIKNNDRYTGVTTLSSTGIITSITFTKKS